MTTKAQDKAIAKIQRLAEELCWNPDKYEIKKFEVTENEFFANVIVEVGMKDDEGTLAAVFCRDCAQLFVGKRGGITYPVSKRMKDGSLKFYRKHFKGYSLLKAVCDQRI